jgi:hypothetical protein
MRLNRKIFLLTCLLLVLLGSVASAQSTRTVPSNDNFASPKTLIPGKDYIVNDIGAATNEAGELETTCTAGPISNSVWYSFTVDAYTAIHFSTAGTMLYAPLNDSIDTIIAIFSSDLSEVVCNDDREGLYSEIDIEFGVPGTYYLVIGTYEDIDYAPESFMKLQTRLINYSQQLSNPGFQTGLSPWVLKNGTADDIQCDNVNYPGESSTCAFRFVGDPNGTSAKLSQTITPAANLVLRKNGTMVLYWAYRAMDTLSISGAKVILTATYTDGTPPTKRAVAMGTLTETPAYQYAQTFLTLASGKVAKFKIQVKFKGTQGTLMFDNFILDYNAAAVTRQALALPLPQ